MFAATDQTAKQYANTARQFTSQLDLLDVRGGVYVFEINPGSTAQLAGVKVGDIIIEYDHQKITDMAIFVEDVKSAQTADTVQISWLRLNAQNKFDRYSKTLPGGSLGVGAMPI
jgi:S1-C subfamily serine protease